MKNNLKTFPKSRDKVYYVHVKWKLDFEAELQEDCKKCGLTIMCIPSMCKFRKTPKEILGE